MRKIIFLGVLLVSISKIYAQDAFKPVKMVGIPVQFSHPVSPVLFMIKEESKYVYNVSDGQTEFYVKFTKTSPRFNADSLKQMFVKPYTDDKEIKNLQVGEIASGTMGNHPCDKLVFSFMAQDKMYLTTAFMVKFYVNSAYNSVLFYFEMGLRNAPSYVMLQEKMIESLKYTEITYKTFKTPKIKSEIQYPDYWTKRENGDSLIFDDGRGYISLVAVTAKDSLPIEKTAEAFKTTAKADVTNYPGNKFKYSKEKMGTETVPHWYGTFDEAYFTGLTRKGFVSKWWFRRKLNNAHYDFVLTIHCPESALSFYDPIIVKVLDSLIIGGVKAGAAVN